MYFCAAQREFIREWIKLEFGVFDEFGYSDNVIFPPFYRQMNSVVLNSCANEIVAPGNFSDVCLTYPNSATCSIDENQLGITSSLLFSADSGKFPQMGFVCDETVHDQDAPTKQNLLCKYRSVKNVIVESGVVSAPFVAPNVVIMKEEIGHEIIIVQDMGRDMEISVRENIGFFKKIVFIF